MIISAIKRILLFVLLIVSVNLNSQNLDIRLLRSFNSQETLPSDMFFRFMSNSEIYFVLGVPATITTTGFIKDNKEMVRNAVVVIAAQAINSGITLALKYSLNRDRPFITYPDITKKSSAGSPSFPSGHTSSSFALATSVTLAYPEWYIIVPSYIWAGTVSYSRMHLGVHYPSDVLAGAIVGSGSAYLTHIINKKLNGNKHFKNSSLHNVK